MSGPGVGIVGLGFMGRTHLGAWRAAAAAGWANRLVAVCDRDPDLRAGRVSSGGNLEAGVAGEPAEQLFEPGEVAAYDDAAALFADDAVDVVSICTHTDSHVALAEAALRAGKHVLVEKPVALDAAAIERLDGVARDAGRVCMPAQCIRFWPGWDRLRVHVEGGDLGALRSLSLRRQGSRPHWGAGFYDDPARSGGALVDLHIHDADLVRWCLGDPRAVFTTGDRDHVSTAYLYESGAVHVLAEGGWDHSPGFAFRMAFTAVFEQGTLDYDLGREPVLTLARDGESQPVRLDDISGYDGEVRHLLDVLAGKTELRATLSEAAGLARLLDAEAASLASGQPVPVGPTREEIDP